MDSGKHKCHVIIQSWTFSGLVGAYLDLAIAYLLLCGSTIAYIASKFLGLFGLCFPCPCNGLFGNPKGNTCLQRVLVDSPLESISAIHSSVKSKFPFNSMWSEDLNYQLNMKLIRDRSLENMRAELEREALSSSVTERKQKGSVNRYSVPNNVTEAEFRVRNFNFPALMEERFDSHGEEVTSQSLRSALRRRRKKAADYGIISSDASSDLLQVDVSDVPQHPFSFSTIGSEKTEGSLEPIYTEDRSEASKDNGFQENHLSDSEMSGAVDEHKSAEKDEFSAEEFVSNEHEDLGFDCNDTNMIRVLAQAIGEEQDVCTTLYNELEKERTAAATAADEAMNMILRLQEEKAAIEMEARQYQRIIEAKSTYDAEEMNILKEILFRREQEKHFLEKEVEAYRQMFFGHEQLNADVFDFLAMQNERASLYTNEDPVLLQGISDFVDEKDKMKSTGDFAERKELKSGSGFRDYEVTFIESKDHTLLSGDKLHILGSDESVGSSRSGGIHTDERISKSSVIHICNDLEFQGNGMVPTKETSLTQQRDTQRLYECPESLGVPDICTKTTAPVERKEAQSNNTTLYQGLEFNETSVPSNGGNNYGKDSDQGSIDSSSLVSKQVPCIHDVHVDDESMSSEISGRKDEQLSVDDSLGSAPTRRLRSEQDRSRSSSEVTSELLSLGPSYGEASLSGLRRSSMSALELKSCNVLGEPVNDSPPLRRLGFEKGLSRSSTGLTSGLPPLGPSRGKPSTPDLRRSMSVLDSERLKLETEVRWLSEKLKMVQKGREKLNISVENKDLEKVQFKLIDDIAKHAASRDSAINRT